MSKTSPARKARLKARHEASAAREKLLADNLRANGFSCSSCLHGDKPFSMQGETVCQLDSDFHGYAVVKPDFVCSRFSNNL